MSGTLVSVYDPTLAFISHVPRRTGVRWGDELNQPNAFSLTMQLDDELLTTVHPSLMNRGRIVTMSTEGAKRRSYVIEQREIEYAADGAARAITVSGRGVLALLGHGEVYPESPGTSGGIRWDQADNRAFDYGSLDGPWRVTSEWVTPVGLRWDDPSSIRKGLPAKYPDPAAEWLWITDPNAPTPPQYCYFRGGFSLTSTTRVKIFAQGDERMRMKLDGEEIIVKGSRWWDLNVYTTTLEAGYHLLASRVQALQHNGANNPAAFLCSVAAVDRNGKILRWIKRSAPSGFLVRQLLPGDDAPGWFPASVLKLLVNEGKERNTHTFDAMTFGFDDTNDTDSNAWTVRHDQSFDIGVSYLDVLEKLVEDGMDVDMSPTLEINAWKERGTDLSDTVRLIPPYVKSLKVTSNEAAMKNRALVRGATGWLQYNDGTSESANGRRETLMTLGGALSDSQARRVAIAGLGDLKDPLITVEVTIDSELGPQPFVDFNVGDTVSSYTDGGSIVPCRVMSVGCAENDETGVNTFTVQLYPVT